MRAFFVLFLFFAAFMVVVTNLLAGVDLTPNTPDSASAAAPLDIPATTSPQVITIQGSPTTTNQSIPLVPVTGGCANPYTVQSGDSLSQIAVICSTTLVAIRQANPQIINANLIYPGQLVNIPNGSVVQIPVTGSEETTSAASLPLPCACDTDPIPVAGFAPMLTPGSALHIRAINYPPNTPVNVATGPKNTAYTVVTHGVTDANGNLTTVINVPTISNSQTLWVVVVSTTDQSPPIWAASQSFYVVSP